MARDKRHKSAFSLATQVTQVSVLIAVFSPASFHPIPALSIRIRMMPLPMCDYHLLKCVSGALTVIRCRGPSLIFSTNPHMSCRAQETLMQNDDSTWCVLGHCSSSPSFPIFSAMYANQPRRRAGHAQMDIDGLWFLSAFSLTPISHFWRSSPLCSF
jgi:hypothetical protein